jgi:hypothetical protein
VVRRLWGPTLAVIVLAASAINPNLIERAGEIMAEPMLIAFIALTLWAYSEKTLSTRLVVIGGVCAIAGALARSAGLPLVAAAGLYLLMERRYKATTWYGLAALATVGVWMVWTIMAPEKVTGRSYMADAVYSGPNPTERPSMALVLIRRVISNIPGYLTAAIPWQLPLPAIEGTAIDNGLWLLVVVGGLVGGAVSTWRRWRAAALLLLMYGGMLAVWPWLVGRFIEPVLPLLFTVIFAGVAAIGVRVGGRRGGLGAVLGLAVVIIGTAAARDVVTLRRLATCDRRAPFQSPGCFGVEERSFFAAMTYIRTHTPDSVIVVVAKDSPFAMLTGRKVMISDNAVAQDSLHFFQYLEQNHVHRIVLTHISFHDDPFSERLMQVCRRLSLEKTFPPLSSIYSWVPPEQAAPDAATWPACQELARYRRVAERLP